MASKDVEKARQLRSHFAQILNVPQLVRLRSSLAAASLTGFLNILIAYYLRAFDGVHVAYDNAPGSLKFPLLYVGCGVLSRADGFRAGSAREC